MQLGDNLGFAGVILAAAGLGITILWPAKRWIGVVCLVVAVLLGLWWGRMAYWSWRHPSEEGSIPQDVPTGKPNFSPKPSEPAASTDKHLLKTATPPSLVFSQGVGQGVGGLVIFNGTDDPIDNVSISIMRSHAGPQYAADPGLLQQDMATRFDLDIGTLRPHLATPITGVPAGIFPYKDRPSFYQISIFTRYESFTEWLYVTPKGDGSRMFDQAVDLSSNKTHRWFRRDTEAAMKRWKNWPEWWK